MRLYLLDRFDKMSTGMFSFQGDFKRRTQINLGRTTHEDRATLLRKAQEERRAREERRRNEVAASKIQVLSIRPSERAILILGVLERQTGCGDYKESD